MEWLIAVLAFAVGALVGALAVVKTLVVAVAELAPIIKALQEDVEAIAEEIDDGL